ALLACVRPRGAFAASASAGYGGWSVCARRSTDGTAARIAPVMRDDENAVARHDRMVREEKAQADAIAGRLPPSDIWQGRTGAFRPSGDETDAALIDALAALAGASGVAIDVGAGGGRVALPLARRCRAVIAVEPSPAMRAVLGEEIARSGVGNVEIVGAMWEE